MNKDTLVKLLLVAGIGGGIWWYLQEQKKAQATATATANARIAALQTQISQTQQQLTTDDENKLDRINSLVSGAGNVLDTFKCSILGRCS